MDIRFYFRRSKAPAPRAPEVDVFDDVAIDLETIGGEINGTYLDIASAPAPEKRARNKAPERAPRERSPERQPERPPQFDRQPERQPEPPPERQFDRQPERPPERQAERQPAPQREQRPPRPRRRSDGNGASPGGERRGVLAVHGVEKSFVGRMVVKGVSLYVRKGEAVGLLGPNGAGKTTVFYMATGLIKADKGRIELDGRNVTKLPMYQRARLGIGYLPQEASIFRGMTVEENVMAVVEMREKDDRRAREEVTGLLEELRIEHLRRAPAVSLSGGERRRVEIARALASEPEFMLLDEPFAGIDPMAMADIRDVIAYLKGRGIGILITDHNVRETLDIIERASIIHAGRVLFEGRPDEVLADPDVRRLYLGDRFT